MPRIFFFEVFPFLVVFGLSTDRLGTEDTKGVLIGMLFSYRGLESRIVIRIYLINAQTRSS